MKYLQERGLDKIIINLKQPVLGICLGQQLLCRYSEEGNVDCLGIFYAGVRKFPAEDIVPHMGWNTLTGLNSVIFNSIERVKMFTMYTVITVNFQKIQLLLQTIFCHFLRHFRKKTSMQPNFTLKNRHQQAKNTKEFSKFIKINCI